MIPLIFPVDLSMLEPVNICLELLELLELLVSLYSPSYALQIKNRIGAGFCDAGIHTRTFSEDDVAEDL